MVMSEVSHLHPVQLSDVPEKMLAEARNNRDVMDALLKEWAGVSAVTEVRGAVSYMLVSLPQTFTNLHDAPHRGRHYHHFDRNRSFAYFSSTNLTPLRAVGIFNALVIPFPFLALYFGPHTCIERTEPTTQVYICICPSSITPAHPTACKPHICMLRLLRPSIIALNNDRTCAVS